jgi:flagellar hook-basal body complex protein FliE
MTTAAAAAGAYANLARLADTLPGKTGAGAGPDFAALLKQAAGAIAEAGQRSDAQAQALAAGKANVIDVVTAVAETEVAVDALVAVRDRVIQAYEEIMRMPI